jgi:predicted ester cyclase
VIVPSDLRDFAVRYTNAWCSQEPERVASFFSPRGWISVNGGAPSAGREALTEFARGFMTAFPDLKVEMDDLITREDVVEYHWTLTGTNSGPGGTGRQVRIRGFEAWKFSSDGLISESLGHYDENEYRRQLSGHSVN